MKKIVLTLLLANGFTMAHAAKYVKRNGALSLSTGNDTAEFNINASHGNASGVCNMEGIAERVGAGAGLRNRWLHSDSSSACVAVISELNNGSFNVMTRSCENYCGVSAEGSMEGNYRKK
ncbi:acyl-CoA dehydrogenase [Pectobacterium versatile]|uniref:acyl-CoA dehydrogenase n=1 Tax=Pectobacterium versatile TaxID=2488639 RepID=UPI001CCF7DFA|nr:acyl-CoA dehydrogenase [Pectobacterium versatile]